MLQQGAAQCGQLVGLQTLALQHAPLSPTPLLLTPPLLLVLTPGWVCSAELVPAFLKLLRDSESEVRSTAAGKVAAFSRMLTPQQVVTQVIPCVKELANDTGQFVRASLAQVGGRGAGTGGAVWEKEGSWRSWPAAARVDGEPEVYGSNDAVDAATTIGRCPNAQGVYPVQSGL